MFENGDFVKLTADEEFNRILDSELYQIVDTFKLAVYEKYRMPIDELDDLLENTIVGIAETIAEK